MGVVVVTGVKLDEIKQIGVLDCRRKEEGS